jgi:hypothetical protein
LKTVEEEYWARKQADEQAAAEKQAAWELTRIKLYQGKNGVWPRDLAAHYEVSDNPTAGLIQGYKDDFSPKERKVIADFRARHKV